MYEVDMVGGPVDGQTYEFLNLPKYIYIPYMPKPETLLPGPTDPWPPVYNVRTLIYRRVLHNLYWYQGFRE